MILGVLLVITCSVALVHKAVTAKTAKRDPLDRPNFVLFFVDDLGYGDCGFTGHPTTQTPNIDSLAWNGKILTTWYSACAVCSCSRASLLTGRQWPRTGVQEVYGPIAQRGLSLNETTIAEQLRQHKNYSTAIVGKWHLGQRLAYLPGNQGFDYYLGVPYAADMGNALYSSCPNKAVNDNLENQRQAKQTNQRDEQHQSTLWNPDFTIQSTNFNTDNESHPTPPNNDYAAFYIPLVYQEFNRTKIVQQPVDYTTLAGHYVDFAQTYIERHQDQPFLLYVPFTHVHMTSCLTDTWEQRPNCQYADCQFQNTSRRGAFGDALAEVDWIVGRVMDSIRQFGLEENTLVVFTSDNGPWIGGGLDGGSAGIFQGRFANYYSTGKGSTWEGGLREPAFAYWKGQIAPHSRSSETISSMDIFPTFSYLAGIPIPNCTRCSITDANAEAETLKLDGRNMADILLRKDGKSQHDFLFFYGFCNGGWPHNNITAVRHGPYKAHFCTAPGIIVPPNSTAHYHPYPMLFQIEQDPSEAFPISTGDMPSDPNHAAAMRRIMRAYAMEVATFEYGPIDPLPPGPGEGPGRYGLCCDRSLNCSCTASVLDASLHHRPWKRMGLFNMGQPAHHDRYHDILGEVNHLTSKRVLEEH
jgi:arylsulfatase A